MSDTIKYGEDAEAPKSGNETAGTGYSESEDHMADPTAMSGTLETSGTSGTTQTAEDVSPVFEEADKAALENPVAPEGVIGAPDIDPAATGEDSLKPQYDGNEPNALTAGDDKGADSADGQEDGQYDPTSNKVADVVKYLDGADDDERERVIAAEKQGDGRKGIVEYKKA
jgi:hypothetical protein